MLCRFISEDEISHYKHFFRYFRKYQHEERSSRAAVLGAMVRRSIEICVEDTDHGLRNAYDERYPKGIATRPTLDSIKLAINARLRSSVPFGIACAMWLRPLQIDSRIERQIRYVLRIVTRTLVFGSLTCSTQTRQLHKRSNECDCHPPT